MYQAPPPPPPPQMWSAPAAAPTPAANTTTSASYFRMGPRPESCAFCCVQGHRVHTCAIAGEYVNSGHTTIINDRIHLPNGQPIPFDGSRRGLQASIDLWLTSQMPTSTPSQAHAVFARDAPPHFDSRNAPTSRIEEVIESHILQVKQDDTPQEEDEEFSHDIFEVFAAEKKKHGDKASKVPELATPPPTTPVLTTSANIVWPNSQFRYQSNAEDLQLVSELEEYLMKGTLSLTTPAHLLAASPAICRVLLNKLKV